MEIKDVIAEVLALQPQYSSANTDVMRKRGELVRRTLPELLAPLRSALATAAGLVSTDFMVEGRDGTGLKSEIPWVRFASRTASPRATTGWYVVLLHRADGAGVYLSLAHGSTQFNAGALVARSDVELSRLMDWSRKALEASLAEHPRLVNTVNLATPRPLALAYEKSCVASFYYAAVSLPNDAEFAIDLLVMAELLGQLYDAERLGHTPLSANPDVRDAIEAVAAISRPSLVVRAQGFGLTVTERRAVESRAMALASMHFQKLGYKVKDVSAKESFDLEATRLDETIKVEVKGTTSALGSVLLTYNEVQLHKAAHPANALVVVHSMQLDRRATMPVAKGGTLRCWQPWVVEESRLKGITFAYELSE